MPARIIDRMWSRDPAWSLGVRRAKPLADARGYVKHETVATEPRLVARPLGSGPTAKPLADARGSVKHATLKQSRARQRAVAAVVAAAEPRNPQC
jgi:hypothetical protein